MELDLQLLDVFPPKAFTISPETCDVKFYSEISVTWPDRFSVIQHDRESDPATCQRWQILHRALHIHNGLYKYKILQETF